MIKPPMYSDIDPGTPQKAGELSVGIDSKALAALARLGLTSEPIHTPVDAATILGLPIPKPGETPPRRFDRPPSAPRF
jgi:hypothetical protein